MPVVRSFFSESTPGARLKHILVLIYLLLGLAVYLYVPVLGFRWIDLPFIGAFVEQTMVFNGSGSTESPSQWPAHQQGLIFGYQLRGIDSRTVSSSDDLRAILESHVVGDTVTLNVLTPEAEERDYPIALIHLPERDRYAYFFVPYLIGLAFLAAAIWIFSIRRQVTSGIAFVLFATSVALGVGTLFDLYTTHRLSAIWSMALPLTAASLIHFVVVYPREPRWIRLHPVSILIPYAIALVLGIVSVTQLNNIQAPMRYALIWRASYGFIGISVLGAMSWATIRYFSSSSPVEKEQLRIILLGTLLAVGPMAIWFIGAPIWTVYFPFSPWLVLPLILMPAAAGYSLQRYRMTQSDFLVSRGVVFGLVTVLVAVGYALLVAGLTLLLNALAVPNSPLVTGLVIVLLALLIQPLRYRLERSVGRVFLRGGHVFDERIKSFGEEISRATDSRSVIQILSQTVEQAVSPSTLHVYTYDPISELYVASMNGKGQTSSDLRFTVTSALAQLLARQREPVFLSDDSMADALHADLPRLQMLGAQVIVPLPGRQRLSGWLALGPIMTGEPYNIREVSFLNALCEQAALALERSQTLANMENRVRGLNVLARVAQGVNVTLTLDDIYELIYAQTTQVVPAREFQLALLDSFSGQLMAAFFVVDEERLDQREKKPLMGGALEYEVLKQRRTILTDDYARECQRRGIMAVRNDLLAWVCVPLNSGAETIGTLTLCNHEASVVYTQEHQNLLEAVADQVAGAIVKARLLQEAERRTRQLAGLNEVTRQLSATLEVEPLLQNVLQSAVDILRCEAGSLLLMDEPTGDLVYRAMQGSFGDTTNTRLAPDGGILWQAARENRPVVWENPSPAVNRAEFSDAEGPFEKRSRVAVPLLLQERVTGVLELADKQDGVRFLPDDVDLLTAFAAQAAVAIENARLYTNTDQALAERVEELSVMQRIDRELNTSLDILLAMKITLEWAMRQTGAQAGLVGRLVEGGVVVMASQGYTTELDSLSDGLLAGEAIDLAAVIETGTVQTRVLDMRNTGLLASATAQVAVPIQRESDMIGLLLLESNAADAVSEDKLNFLQRLSDHAAIAISNAQLYAAIQAANVAKSEFVSFVAHELKNPMTSIKGYTELLAAGAVGSINEGQSSFLTTIRANIDRMNTLVSDLNDVSKIEAGRLRLDYKAMRLMDVVEETVRSTRRQIEEKSQKLEIRVADDLPMLWADRTRVSQVLVNLVSNAHKYTDNGGQIFLGAEKSLNQWDEKGAREVVHIWVRDTGIGISPEDQKKIFQKFFRSEDPKTREAPGTGLGLNITRSLVEMQGGRIWFESEFRKGTTFHFTVPVAEQA